MKETPAATESDLIVDYKRAFHAQPLQAFYGRPASTLTASEVLRWEALNEAGCRVFMVKLGVEPKEPDVDVHPLGRSPVASTDHATPLPWKIVQTMPESEQRADERGRCVRQIRELVSERLEMFLAREADVADRAVLSGLRLAQAAIEQLGPAREPQSTLDRNAMLIETFQRVLDALWDEEKKAKGNGESTHYLRGLRAAFDVVNRVELWK